MTPSPKGLQFRPGASAFNLGIPIVQALSGKVVTPCLGTNRSKVYCFFCMNLQDLKTRFRLNLSFFQRDLLNSLSTIFFNASSVSKKLYRKFPSQVSCNVTSLLLFNGNTLLTEGIYLIYEYE